MGQNFPVVSIAPGEGVQVVDIGAADSVEIPDMANGIKPKYVFIVAYGADDTETITVAPSHGAVDGVAETDFPLPVRTNSSVIMNVTGYDYIRYDIFPASATTSTLSIIALEDF
jgi:hypothetical protein